MNKEQIQQLNNSPLTLLPPPQKPKGKKKRKLNTACLDRENCATLTGFIVRTNK